MGGKADDTTPAGALFGAVSGLAQHLAPELELAPKDENEGEVELAIRLLGAMHERAAALSIAVDQTTLELAHVRRQMAGYKGRANLMAKAVGVLEARIPKERRRFADAAPFGTEELLELIDDAETVEIVFLDETGLELPLPPREIHGDKGAWQVTDSGLRLRVPELKVSGPAEGQPAIPLGGYALLVDGELAGRQHRAQLTIGAGQQYRLEDDIIFGPPLPAEAEA